MPLDKLIDKAEVRDGRLSLPLASVLGMLILGVAWGLYWSAQISEDLQHHRKGPIAVSHEDAEKRIRTLEDAGIRAALAAEQTAKILERFETERVGLYKRQRKVESILERAFPAVTRSVEADIEAEANQ